MNHFTNEWAATSIETLEENDYRCAHCREGAPNKMFCARSVRSIWRWFCFVPDLFDMKTWCTGIRNTALHSHTSSPFDYTHPFQHHILYSSISTWYFHFRYRTTGFFSDTKELDMREYHLYLYPKDSVVKNLVSERYPVEQNKPLHKLKKVRFLNNCSSI